MVGYGLAAWPFLAAKYGLASTLARLDRADRSGGALGRRPVLFERRARRDGRPAGRRAIRIADPENRRRRLYRCRASRHRCRCDRVGPHASRPRHPGIPQHDQGLGRGDLCLSAAGWRRGRYAQDGDRRPRRGRRHQGAATGARHLRAGKAERTKGRAHRTGAAEYLHQLGRQYRARRNRAGADRISGAGAPVGRPVLTAHPHGGRAALQPGAGGADRRFARRR